MSPDSHLADTPRGRRFRRASRNPRDGVGDFLRARRSELNPVDLGLPAGTGVRRVPGLRREEVAELAAISTDYYTRLEQGRIRPSAVALQAVAAALRLDDDEYNYLIELAGLDGRRFVQPTEGHLHQLRAVLDDMAHTPAFAIGARTEVVAWNTMAAALITDFGVLPEDERYYIRLLVTDPRMRTLYADWPDVTQLAVEQMRRHNAAHPSDPVLRRLLDELLPDDDFRRWWRSHQVAPRVGGVKHLRHPLVGDLHLHWNALTWNPAPEIQIIAWTPEAGTDSADRLRRLAELSR